MSPRAEKQRPLRTTRGKKSKAVRDGDVTLGGEASTTSLGPDVNREQSRGGCASQGEATLPGQSAKNGPEMRPPGRRAEPGSSARGPAVTAWAAAPGPRRPRAEAVTGPPSAGPGGAEAPEPNASTAAGPRPLARSPGPPQPQRVEARRRRADIPRPAGPRPAPACGPRPLATVGGGAGRGRTEISLSFSLSPRGKGEWRRDRLRELQLPCGLRNSRGVCRGDAIMASVLAREAAALRRRCEHLPTACAPPSAQAPWARGSREGPVGQGAEPALGASCARFHRRTPTNMRSCPPVLRELTHWALTSPSHVHVTC